MSWSKFAQYLEAGVAVEVAGSKGNEHNDIKCVPMTALTEVCPVQVAYQHAKRAVPEPRLCVTVWTLSC